MSLPRTLGELKVSRPAEPRPSGQGGRVSVREEMRRNLLRKLEAREPIFPGIVGYDDSVVPQLVNAVLSKHNMILLGLRGQAKSRILRSLTSLLDAATPMIAGCEINDDPFRPLCRRCRDLLKDRADETPIGFVPKASSLIGDGLDIAKADVDHLLSVDRDGWKNNLKSQRDFFDTFGDHLPAGLKEEHNALGNRLKG